LHWHFLIAIVSLAVMCKQHIPSIISLGELLGPPKVLVRATTLWDFILVICVLLTREICRFCMRPGRGVQIEDDVS
jgi:hypothetical protein